MTTGIYLDIAAIERAVCETDVTTYTEADIDNYVTRRYPVGKTWTRYELECLPDGSRAEYAVTYRVTGYKQYEAWNRHCYCNEFYPTTEVVCKREVKGPLWRLRLEMANAKGATNETL